MQCDADITACPIWVWARVGRALLCKRTRRRQHAARPSSPRPLLIPLAVQGTLKGYDQLLNLVLDEAIEFLRGGRLATLLPPDSISPSRRRMLLDAHSYCWLRCSIQTACACRSWQGCRSFPVWAAIMPCLSPLGDMGVMPWG